MEQKEYCGKLYKEYIEAFRESQAFVQDARKKHALISADDFSKRFNIAKELVSKCTVYAEAFSEYWNQIREDAEK